MGTCPPSCPFCLGTQFVCEAHPERAWPQQRDDDSDPRFCHCGAPGMVCQQGGL